MIRQPEGVGAHTNICSHKQKNRRGRETLTIADLQGTCMQLVNDLKCKNGPKQGVGYQGVWGGAGVPKY